MLLVLVNVFFDIHKFPPKTTLAYLYTLYCYCFGHFASGSCLQCVFNFVHVAQADCALGWCIDINPWDWADPHCMSSWDRCNGKIDCEGGHDEEGCSKSGRPGQPPAINVVFFSALEKNTG